MLGYVNIIIFFSAKLVVDKFRAERQKDTFRTLSNFSAVRLYIFISQPLVRSTDMIYLLEAMIDHLTASL